MKLGLIPVLTGVLCTLTPLYGGAEITVYVHPGPQHSRLVLKLMRAEASRTVKGTEAKIDWTDKWASGRSVPGRLVSVSLLGSCVAAAPPRSSSG